ncbi:MAG TPA: Rap1a/Tai family immunity protein [Sphingobium sp.]|uniref:Rap1a/Tai family immunity protein n=1 Tax=Sphingobium sp. TaxID=1912891 RepID=UPI002ED6B663
MMLALSADAQERTRAPGAPATKASTAVAAIPPAAPAVENLSDIGYMTASQLASRCSQNDPARSSYCFAYIAAVTDTARAYEIWLGTREFCLPARIAQSEIRRAFMTYVSAYPAQASGQAASVVVNALKLTYPCD